MFEYKEDITREFILNRISQEDIFFKYLGLFPNTHDYFRNPLRSDNHADCRFYFDSRGLLKFKDFARGDNIDCFNVVQRLFGVNFFKALEIIANDFQLSRTNIDYKPLSFLEEVHKRVRKNTEIRIKRRGWSKADIKFWRDNFVSEAALAKFNVYPLDMAWINGNLSYNYVEKDPGYAYHFGEYRYKLYFPKRKFFKFIQATGDILEGWDQLPEEGESLLITKSYKDVMALDGFEIPSLAPAAESILIGEKEYCGLENRFFNVFSLFDRDRAGMRMAQIMRKTYGTKPLLFESNGLFRRQSEPKDFTDHCKHYGLQYMLDLIEEAKYELV